MLQLGFISYSDAANFISFSELCQEVGQNYVIFAKLT